MGGTVLEELLRLGIGTITGVDMDVFELSNLNRQLLATEENIGLHKAEAARLRARQINSGVRFIPVTEKQDFGSMCDLFRDADVVVDALGGLADRQALEKAAAEKGVPVVSAGIAGLTGLVQGHLSGRDGARVSSRRRRRSPYSRRNPRQPRAHGISCGVLTGCARAPNPDRKTRPAGSLVF